VATGGLTLGAIALGACFGSVTSPASGSDTSPGDAGPTSDVGEIRLQVKLATASFVASSLSWTLLEGADVGGGGTIDLAATQSQSPPYQVPAQEIASVNAGAAYVIKVTSAEPGVSCSGTSAAFSVEAQRETEVPVLVNCEQPDSSYPANPIVEFCPTLETLGSDQPDGGATPVGGTALITAAAVGPNQAGVTYAWTNESPTLGTLGSPSNNAGFNSQVAFTCDAAGTATIAVATADEGVPLLYCSDQTLAGDATCALATSTAGTPCGQYYRATCVQVVCPAAETSSTVTVVCANP
jgi:hypothetical protein